MSEILKKLPEVKVSVGFVLFLALVSFIDRENMFFLALACALVHEVSHLIAIYICGGRAERINFAVYGAYIELGRYPMIPYKKEFWIAAAGPIASAGVAYVFSVIGQCFRNDMFFVIAGINLMLALLNLIPAYPLDGGRMLRCFMLAISDEKITDIVCVVLGTVSAVAVLVFCVLFNFRVGFQLSMTVFCAFVIVSVVKNIVWK